MMKKVIKRARETSTWLGGVCCVPIAVLRKDKTTIMRTNDVTMIRMDGAKESTVIRAIV